jgi:hypothetical protein
MNERPAIPFLFHRERGLFVKTERGLTLVDSVKG